MFSSQNAMFKQSFQWIYAFRVLTLSFYLKFIFNLKFLKVCQNKLSSFFNNLYFDCKIFHLYPIQPWYFKQ